MGQRRLVVTSPQVDLSIQTTAMFVGSTGTGMETTFRTGRDYHFTFLEHSSSASQRDRVRLSYDRNTQVEKLLARFARGKAACKVRRAKSAVRSPQGVPSGSFIESVVCRKQIGNARFRVGLGVFCSANAVPIGFVIADSSRHAR